MLMLWLLYDLCRRFPAQSGAHLFSADQSLLSYACATLRAIDSLLTVLGLNSFGRLFLDRSPAHEIIRRRRRRSRRGGLPLGTCLASLLFVVFTRNRNQARRSIGLWLLLFALLLLLLSL